MDKAKRDETIQLIIDMLSDERIILGSVKNEQGLGMLPQLNITILSKDPDLIDRLYRIALGQFETR